MLKKKEKKRNYSRFIERCRSLPSLIESSLSYGRRLVDQFVLVSGSLLGPTTIFYPYRFFSDNYLFFLHVGRPL
jgi:hypothetical protein